MRIMPGWIRIVLVLATTALAGCDALEPEPAPLTVSLHALEGCTSGAGALSDISSVTVEIRGLDASTGEQRLLKRVNASPSDGMMMIQDVPEGTGRSVAVSAEGDTRHWFAKDPSVTIQTGVTNTVDLLLTPYAEPACIQTPTTFPNVIFPAMVELGDGRVMIVGGFTKLVTEGSQQFLKGATDQALIFDPRTGTVESAGSMGDGQGRAGHAMVYVPSLEPGSQGVVLIYGGLTEMEVDVSRPFPFIMDTEEARRDYVIYDIASGAFSARGPGEGGVNPLGPKRGFPRAHLLADNTVMITGGGEWPEDPSAEKYKDVVIYDPGQDTLLDIKNFDSFWYRAGHSVTFIKNVQEEMGDGTLRSLSHLLVWGGTPASGSDQVGRVAEIYKQSGQQTEGINGSFDFFDNADIKGDMPPYTFFHEMTRLSGQRYLLTGGVRYGSGGLEAPRADEAWLIEYNDLNGPQVLVQKVEGLGAGRVFHTAATADFNAVTVVGGWDGLNAIQSDRSMFFDLGADSTWTTAPEADLVTPRGGMGGVMQLNDSLLLVGGESSPLALEGEPKSAFVEIYTPSIVPSP